ncbi:MAG: tetratricopeptide repeat protein [Clostridiales bacterium]|nr:tetratricopeptide repeat protein [Clostridiales bacterium]
MGRNIFFGRKVEYLLLFVILILILSAYSNSLYAPVTLDDMHSFVEEPRVLNFTFSWESVYELTETRFGWARFLPVLSFALDLQWGSGSVIFFHITNITIHLLATLALFFLLNSFFSFISYLYDSSHPVNQRRSSVSIIVIFIVGLWALNPVQTNAVTYLVQRMTSMAALFYFIALGGYLRGRMLQLQGVSAGKTAIWYLIFFLSAICSFMSKQISVTLPAMVLLVEFLFVHCGSLKSFLKKYRFLLVLVLLLLIPLVYYKFPGILARCGVRHFTISERLLTELRVMSSYIFLFLLPLPQFLNLEHDPLVSTSLFNPFTTFISLLFLFVIVVYAWQIRKRYPVITFAVYWFFINLMIESSVIPLELKFEHRLYLPSVGLCIVLVLLLNKVVTSFLSGFYDERNQKLIYIASIMILLSGLSMLTFERNNVWRDPISLYSDCTFKSPHKPRAHGNLARSLCKCGEYKDAIVESEKALSLGVKGYEVYWTAAANLIAALSQLDENQHAIERGEALLTGAPSRTKKNSYPIFLNNLGNIYVKESEYQKACNTYIQGFKFASNNKFADSTWKPFLSRFANALLNLFKICEEQKVFLDVEGLAEVGTELSACEKTAQVCLNLNVLDLAARYCETFADKNGSTSLECSSIKKKIKERNLLNSAQQRRGTIKTNYYHHPFAGKFNFYMAVVYGLEKVGLQDCFLIDYFLQSATDLQPDNPDVILLRSWLYYQRSQFDEAICEIDKAIKLDNEYAQLWINRGLYSIDADRYEEALAAFTKAEELYPGNPKNIKLDGMINVLKDKISLNSQGGDHG